MNHKLFIHFFDYSVGRLKFIDLGHVLKQYLALNGFAAQRVFNGEEARNELRENAYDILVIDVMMPKEDGFTLAPKVSQH